MAVSFNSSISSTICGQVTLDRHRPGRWPGICQRGGVTLIGRQIARFGEGGSAA
jgi:hypothetical protein